jgi:hypothetical protein
VAEEHSQEVNPSQPHLPQVLKTITQGLYFAEVLPGRPLTPGGQGNRATMGTRRERGGIMIL